MSCGVGHKHGSDLMLLWLWCRPAAVAPTRPLAWESPYAVGMAPQKKQIKNKNFKKLLLLLFVFLGPYLWHMEVPRLGVKCKLQLLAYTTARATSDPSHNSDLCCSLWQPWIPSPLSKARDLTCILMDTSHILNPLSHNRNTKSTIF